MLLTTLNDKLKIVSKDNIELIGDNDIKVYADKYIYNTSATKDIYNRARKNIESFVSEDFKTHSEKRTSINVENDLAISTNKDLYQYVALGTKNVSGETTQLVFLKSWDIIVISVDFNIAE